MNLVLDTAKGYTNGKTLYEHRIWIGMPIVPIKCSRYNGNANSALKMLNKARVDPAYSQKSLILMIEIYLNPTSVVLGGEAFVVDSSTDGSLGSGSADAKEQTAKTVENLLRVKNWAIQIA
jgi:hypothetical protein